MSGVTVYLCTWIRVARFYLQQELLNQLTGRLTDHYSPADPIHCRAGEREMKSLQPRPRATALTRSANSTRPTRT